MTLEERGSTRSERRRRRWARRRSLRVLALVAALGLAAGVPLALTRDENVPGFVGRVGTEIEGDQVTYLVVLTNSRDVSQRADALTLFAVDRTRDNPTVLFVPVSTLGVIPGQGFEAVGKAMSVGRAPLAKLTVENLLGIVVDHVIALDEAALAALVDESGGVTIDVREKLLRPGTGGELVPLFPRTGPIQMTGRSALRYLTFRGPGESEIDAFVRAQRFWEALFARVSDTPRLFGGAMAALARAGALDATPGEVVEFFGAVAAADPARRSFQVLPVSPVGAGGPAEAYAVDGGKLEQMVRRVFAESLPPDGPGAGARVEILNGNGRPEVGSRVAERLVPAGMKIIVSGNARSFDFRRTLIVIYADDSASHALADRVRRLLGVGRIQVGRRAQTIVDVTIVVGADFPTRTG